MKYMGSKNRIAKYILPIMLENKKKEQWWIEPFVGGANIIDKVQGKRVGSDIDENVIKALRIIRDSVNCLPKNNKEFTEKDYKNLKNNNYKYKAYAGFAFSYSGKWMGGWCRDKENKRDYVKESYKNAIKQSVKLQNLFLIQKDYKELKIPKNSFIYCDPPYKNTTRYKNNNFNHDIFWEWCREKSKKNTVFISEYEAPYDFECIWKMEIASSLTKNTGSKKGIEKLFKLKNR